MKPIENLRRLLDGQCPAWIPFSLDVGASCGFSEPILRRFLEAGGSGDPADYFGADVRRYSLHTRFGGDDPSALHGALPAGTYFDPWGIGHWAGGSEGTLDRMFAPLAHARSVAEVERLPAPLVDRPPDTPVPACHAAGYPVFGYAGSIYEWSWWLRGMEQFMVDMVDQPPMAEAIVARVESHTTQLALASARAGIDVLCFYDDAGMQRGMQISPALWRRYIKPAWKRVLEAVRREAAEARFFIHSCGKIDPIVPDLVEVGFHLLHPVQPECMDFAEIYRRWGRQIVVCGTLSAQKTFPFGTPQEVRSEVRRLAQLASDRRTLLLPSNVIQPETPWENVLAFAEEARALRPS